jgi:hypothetical protein
MSNKYTKYGSYKCKNLSKIKFQLQENLWLRKIDTGIVALCNVMSQSQNQEANSRLEVYKIIHILWKPKVHYHVYESPPMVSVLSEMNAGQILTSILL